VLGRTSGTKKKEMGREEVNYTTRSFINIRKPSFLPAVCMGAKFVFPSKVSTHSQGHRWYCVGQKKK